MSVWKNDMPVTQINAPQLKTKGMLRFLRLNLYFGCLCFAVWWLSTLTLTQPLCLVTVHSNTDTATLVTVHSNTDTATLFSDCPLQHWHSHSVWWLSALTLTQPLCLVTVHSNTDTATLVTVHSNTDTATLVTVHSNTDTATLFGDCPL